MEANYPDDWEQAIPPLFVGFRRNSHRRPCYLPGLQIVASIVRSDCSLRAQ